MNKKLNIIILSLSLISLIMMLFILTNCSVSPGSSGTSGPPPVYHYTNRVAVIGDSVSVGLNYELLALYGWVNMMNGENYLGYSMPYPNIHSIWADTLAILSNYSFIGATASYWNDTFSLSPITNFNPNIVILFIGGNDLLNYLNPDGCLTTAETNSFSNNFCGILDKLTNSLKNSKIVLVDYYDLFDGYSMGVSNFTGHKYLTNLSSYTIFSTLMLSNIASNYGCSFVDNYPSFMHHCYGNSFGDTTHQTPEYMYQPTNNYDIHPVTAGYRKIFDNVLAALKNITN